MRNRVLMLIGAVAVVATVAMLVVLLVSKDSPTSAGTAATALGAATTSAKPTSAPSATSTPKVLQKRLGEIAGAGSAACAAGGVCPLQFVVTKITDCMGQGHASEPTPVGIKRKLVWMDIVTGPDYDPVMLASHYFTTFAAIDAAGVSSSSINPSTYWDCAPTGKRLGYGDNWLPGKKYSGAVEVYLPDDTVKLSNGEGLWEWSLN